MTRYWGASEGLPVGPKIGPKIRFWYRFRNDAA